MAKPIDSLFVEVVSVFDDEGFKDAVDGLDNVKKSSMQSGAALGKLKGMASFAAAGVAAAMAAVVGTSVAVGKKFDDLGKKSKLIGTSARELQMLGLAIEDAGGNSEEAFNWVYGLSSAIASDKTSGELRKALAKESQGAFDLSVLQIKDVQERSIAVLGEFNKLSDDAKKRVAPVLGLSESLQTLSQSGVQGIKNTIAELEAVRGVDIDADALADQGQQLNNHLLKLQTALGGVGEVIAMNALPSINSMLGGLTEFTTIGAKSLNEFFQGTISGFQFLEELIRGFDEAFGISDKVESFNESMASVGETFSDMADEVGDFFSDAIFGEDEKPTLDNIDQNDFLQKSLAKQRAQMGISQDAKIYGRPDTQVAIDKAKTNQLMTAAATGQGISTTTSSSNNTNMNNNITVNVNSTMTRPEDFEKAGRIMNDAIRKEATSQAARATAEFKGVSQ